MHACARAFAALSRPCPSHASPSFCCPFTLSLLLARRGRGGRGAQLTLQLIRLGPDLIGLSDRIS
eukprot:1852113-Prymnesium_polylepis.1